MPRELNESWPRQHPLRQDPVRENKLQRSARAIMPGRPHIEYSILGVSTASSRSDDETVELHKRQD